MDDDVGDDDNGRFWPRHLVKNHRSVTIRTVVFLFSRIHEFLTENGRFVHFNTPSFTFPLS
ncbi:MAG: hypothetical protein IAF02_07105 [Anaerolineae bacterium]|nr:hypothetical protein [Anaerolineae bacterium]